MVFESEEQRQVKTLLESSAWRRRCRERMEEQATDATGGVTPSDASLAEGGFAKWAGWIFRWIRPELAALRETVVLLQWHYMLTSAGYPADSMQNLQINTLWDGIFI